MEKKEGEESGWDAQGCSDAGPTLPSPPSTQLLPTGLVDEQISCLGSSYQPPPIGAKPIELQRSDSLEVRLPSSRSHLGLR